MRAKGFGDHCLYKLAVASFARAEFAAKYEDGVLLITWTLDWFILGVWTSVRALEPHKIDELLADASQLGMWVMVFKLYCVLER